MDLELVARSKFTKAKAEKEREGENAMHGAVGRKEGRKEGDRRAAAVDGQFLNANNGGVERGLADENAGRQ